jgi:prevent-host-death family protein
VRQVSSGNSVEHFRAFGAVLNRISRLLARRMRPPAIRLRHKPFDSDRGELYSLMDRTGEFMNDSIVVTALDARANFGKLLRRVEEEGQSLVIAKRGSPRAVLLSIKDYVRLAVPEPEVLRIIGRESQEKGTNKLSSKQTDQIINATRKSQTRSRKRSATRR